MRTILMAALLFLFLFATSLARAQVPSMPVGYSQCQESGTPQAFQYGVARVYTRCIAPTGVEEYGRAFVQFAPPDGIGLAGVPAQGNRRREFLRTLRRYFVQNNNSGLITLSLTLNQDGQRTPLDIIPLASFSYSEQNGVTVQNLVSNLSNQVGYRFRANSNTRIESQLLIRYTNRSDPQLLTRVEQLRQGLSGLGYLPAAQMRGAIAPLATIEQSIAQLFTTDNNSARPVTLAFEPAGLQAASFQFQLTPQNASPSGQLFIGITRDTTLFSGLRPELAGEPRQLRFNLSAFGESETGPIQRGLIAGRTLNQLLPERMGASFGLLSSPQPGEFDVACSALKTALTRSDLDLTTQDVVAAMWGFTVGNSNIRQAEVRGRDCYANQLPGFQSYGLAMPPIREVIAPEFQAIREAAANSAGQGETSAQAARAARALALQRANAARASAGEAGLAREVNQFYEYAGDASTADRTYSGTFTRFAADGTAGDVYSGEFRLAGAASHIPHGKGVFVFQGGAPLSAGRQDFAGELRDRAFSGYGVLTYVDGRQFAGQFANDLPNGHGRMRFADGRVQFGEFQDGVAVGRGLEVSPDGRTRIGTFIGGQLTTGPQQRPAPNR
jgi:hypothetical protein